MKVKKIMDHIPVEFLDTARRFGLISMPGHVLVLAAMPRSASRLFSDNMEKLYRPGFRSLRCKVAKGWGQNFLSYERMMRSLAWRRAVALYGHTPMTRENEAILGRFTADRKAVVLIRNLPDVVVSYTEFVDQNQHGPLDPRIGDGSEGCSQWATLRIDEKYRFITYFVMPWYARFLASWTEARSRGWNVVFVRYEDHTARPVTTIVESLENLGISLKRNGNQTDEEFAGRKLNFNKGRAGRGATELAPEFKEFIAYAVRTCVPDLEADLFDYLTRG